MAEPTDGCQPWDDDALRADTIAAMRAQPRYPLPDVLARADLPVGPAAYALSLYVPDHHERRPPPGDAPALNLAVFGVLLTGVFPVYVGSARSLRARLLRHQTTFERAVGLGPDDVLVSWLTGSYPATLYTEAVVLEQRPILADPRLAGLGSRQPGRGRPGARRRVSGWDALVPSGRWGREPTMLEHARAVLEVAVRVSEPGAFEPRWAPIPAGEAT